MPDIIKTLRDLYFNLYLMKEETETPRPVGNLSEHITG